MSADIINLRQARKQRARDRKSAEAAENRTRFGRTKAERAVEELSRARAEQALDGHQRVNPKIAETPAAVDPAPADPPEKPSRSPQ